ncbi:hypothetical protein GXP70_27125 [Paenibacillus lycopersici]|uniref:Uncharacterized protein n=1 Tax=Paenibacillus lycopersici TaxID=2704462 RepID=A0A6C0G4U7_9BACL|nr:hypothetical protein [Paenibacillus lycopersici]QHT63273.1 hypothetical protein GXP70_27125 [Paenibacillus lycopersici]
MAVLKSMVCAMLAGIVMYLIDMFYYYEHRQAVPVDLQAGSGAEYVPETFKSYLITNSPWLDAALIALTALFFFYAASRASRKRRAAAKGRDPR